MRYRQPGCVVEIFEIIGLWNKVSYIDNPGDCPGALQLTLPSTSGVNAYLPPLFIGLVHVGNNANDFSAKKPERHRVYIISGPEHGDSSDSGHVTGQNQKMKTSQKIRAALHQKN